MKYNKIGSPVSYLIVRSWIKKKKLRILECRVSKVSVRKCVGSELLKFIKGG